MLTGAKAAAATFLAKYLPASLALHPALVLTAQKEFPSAKGGADRLPAWGLCEVP